MAERPKRPCSKPGCPKLSDTGWCDVHKQQEARRQFDKHRPSAWRRGYDSAWEVVRKQALLRDKWLCQEHLILGILVPAEEVDHIVPIKEAPELRLELSNTRSLCKPCHSRKTATEDSGFARRD